MSIRSYQDLEVWQMSMDLAVDCYKSTAKFPKEETYGPTAQIRRASVSVPSNIAEGYGRDQSGSFIQFLRISQGSARELETQLMLAQRVGFLDDDIAVTLLKTCERISKMLRSLIKSIDNSRLQSA